MANDSFFDSLLGHTLTFGPDRYRLQKVLGGGATAVVFLGVDPDDPESQGRQVAVKVAKAEAQWQQALAREWRNLRILAEAEESHGTHYFPRALYPAGDGELRQDIYLEGEWATFLILVQELVPGEGVHDLLLDYPPGLRLPEPLTLEIARQYAEMLAILHDAGLTCADRKLADLRWQRQYNFRQGEPDDLARWRSEPPGHLMVLDWNVTERASSGPFGTIALDLFRFGILWHRMLLGVEPRFRRGGGWQLEEPLEKHPVWPQLSFGTRQILARLLHPIPEQRYEDAKKLLGDLDAQIERWNADGLNLDTRFKPVHDRYVRSFEHPEAALTQAEAEAAFAAADVLRVRIEGWSERQPDDFERVHRGLWRAVTEAPFRKLREAMTAARWEDVQQEIGRLRKTYSHDPARLLHLDRQQQIAGLADETRGDWEEVKPLFKQSNLIFAFDRPGEVETDKTLNDEHVSVWKGEAEVEGDKPWKPIRERLWREAGYRLALSRARRLRDSGDYRAASDVFEHTLALREYLARHSPRIISWLDQLYGDPATEQKEVSAIVKAGEDVEGAFEQGLRAILEGSPTLEEAINGVTAVLRVTSDNPFLGSLYGLLESMRAYRRANEQQNLLLEIHHLGRMSTGWRTLGETSETSVERGGRNLAALGQILEQYSQQIGDQMASRQSELRLQVLQRIGAKPVVLSDQTAESLTDRTQGVSDAWDIRLLIEAYQQAFPNDDEFSRDLRPYVLHCRQQAMNILKRQLPRPVTFQGLQEQVQLLARERQQAVRWTQRGEIVAETLKLEWPPELSPEAVEKRMEARRKAVLEKKVQAAGCLEFLFGRR